MFIQKDEPMIAHAAAKISKSNHISSLKKK